MSAKTTSAEQPAGPNAQLEGDDPPPEDDDILVGIIPADKHVSDEEAEDAITDVIGGGANARWRAERVLARFAEERWRIVRRG